VQRSRSYFPQYSVPARRVPGDTKYMKDLPEDIETKIEVHNPAEHFGRSQTGISYVRKYFLRGCARGGLTCAHVPTSGAASQPRKVGGDPVHRARAPCARMYAAALRHHHHRRRMLLLHSLHHSPVRLLRMLRCRRLPPPRLHPQAPAARVPLARASHHSLCSTRAPTSRA
jgi:hypothetical protein